MIRFDFHTALKSMLIMTSDRQCEDIRSTDIL